MAEDPQTLFAELDDFIQAESHEEALEVCERILALAADDGDAFHCKLISLIELGRYAEAVQAVEAHGELAAGREFEHAYCLYQLNREPEALALLNKLDKEVQGRLDDEDAAPWTARNFSALYKQLLSIAVQKEVATQILDASRRAAPSAADPR